MTMRKKANMALLFLSILFVLTAIAIYMYPGIWWTKLLLFTAEAGLVGALADLFAVTVLFRHPFGLKRIPHTAIIPRNRDKIIEGVVHMVENQLLSVRFLKEQLRQLGIVDMFIRGVERLRGQTTLLDICWDFMLVTLEKMNTERVSKSLDQYVKSGLKKQHASSYAGKSLKWLLQHDDFHKWLDYIVDYASEKAARQETKSAIRTMIDSEKTKFVNEGSSMARWFKQKIVEFAESTNAINLDEAVETMHRDMMSFLKDLHRPDHELRALLADQLYKLADRLENHDNLSVTVEEWKNELLDEISLQPTIQIMIESIVNSMISNEETSNRIVDELKLNESEVRVWISNIIASYWDWFKQDKPMQEKLEHYLQQFVEQIIETQHGLIGEIVRNTLDEFTEERIVQFIESKVEVDLQRIRLNGAFIGAAVGAVLFLFLHGIYTPLLNWL